jgi:hypothetical protein
MRTMGQLLTPAVLLASVTWSPLPAQGQSGKTAKAIAACSLLSNAEVAKVTSRQLFTAPEATSLAGGAGSGCTFDVAQLVLFSGDNAEENWEAFLKNYRHDKDKRYPLEGIGERAYGFYPKPRDKYEDTNAFVVVKLGQHMIAVSVAAEEGKPAESVQPHAVALAKIVVSKLR